MRLSKTHKYVILCEDKLMACYIRRFLREQGINGRKISTIALPANGCGEQYVRLQFPRYLRGLRSKNFDANVLVVVIDADRESCTKRKKQLKDACTASNVALWSKDDKLLLFVPKRNIETWIKHFNGDVVDENDDYAHFLNGHESDCYPAAKKMSDAFSCSFSCKLPSLQDAYNEYVRVSNLIMN